MTDVLCTGTVLLASLSKCLNVIEEVSALDTVAGKRHASIAAAATECEKDSNQPTNPNPPCFYIARQQYYEKAVDSGKRHVCGYYVGES